MRFLSALPLRCCFSIEGVTLDRDEADGGGTHASEGGDKLGRGRAGLARGYGDDGDDWRAPRGELPRASTISKKPEQLPSVRFACGTKNIMTGKHGAPSGCKSGGIPLRRDIVFCKADPLPVVFLWPLHAPRTMSNRPSTPPVFVLV